MRYALLVALLLAVASPLFARTIVLPVQPTVIDANGVEVPELFPDNVESNTAIAEANGYYWRIDLDDAGISYLGNFTNGGGQVYVYCRAVGAAGSFQECYAPFPTFTGFATPMRVELR